MANEWRVSYLFQQQTPRACGWSENFWHGPATPAQIHAAQLALRPKLLSVHGSAAINTYVRMSQVDTTRLVVDEFPDTINLGAKESEQGTDYPTTSLLLSLSNDIEEPTYRKTRQWIRGVPDDVTKNAGSYQPDSAFVTRVNALVEHLASPASNWVIRIRNPAEADIPITAVTALGVVTGAANTFAFNDLVQLKGKYLPSFLKRTWRVAPGNVATEFHLAGFDPPKSFTGWTGIAYARRVSYIYSDIKAGYIVRTSKRNVGRPFGSPTGRRSTRA